MVEMTSDNLRRALAAADIDTETDQNYDIIKGRDTIQDEDFEENITFIGNILGEDKPMIIQVFNAFHEGGLTFSAEDKNNAGVECQFYGYLMYMTIRSRRSSRRLQSTVPRQRQPP